jgi:organic hydroperoxide reductase OsmC/OhrA
MIKYPLNFKAAASSKSGISNSWSSGAGELLPIECAIPTEFQGPGNGYSPEDLLCMTVINCFIATFKVFAERSSLSFDSIDAEGLLEIGRDSSGRVGVTKLILDISLRKASDAEKAQLILGEAQKNCLMANALKIAVEFKMRTL